MIKHPDKFSSWLPALFDGQFHWEFLKPAFGDTRIEPMDFDAVVERRGKMLILETKQPGVDILLGQALTLTQAWRMGASIMVVSGKTPQTIDGFAIYSGPVDCQVGDKPIKPADWTDVLYAVRRWYCMADGQPAPSREEWDNDLWLWDHAREAG